MNELTRKCYHFASQPCTRAVHGNGNPHGNGNRFGLWTGMGMGIMSREWEWRIFLYVKIPITGHAKCVAAQTSSYTCD